MEETIKDIIYELGKITDDRNLIKKIIRMLETKDNLNEYCRFLKNKKQNFQSAYYEAHRLYLKNDGVELPKR